MTRNEMIDALNTGNEVEIDGTRLQAEGAEWTAVHPNKSFESFPRTGAEAVSAGALIDWAQGLGMFAAKR